MESAPEMNLIVSSSEQSMYIYLSIIMLALAFGIINTMLMAVLERTREIGMLMALGMSRVKVFMMILLETCFLVLTSTPIGLLLAAGTVGYYGHYGIDRSDAKAALQSFGLSEIIYPVLITSNYITILELVIITAFVSAIFPARKALSLNPSEAIRK
jgi:ABC-type antimicrobial peptide transport system permease subunit